MDNLTVEQKILWSNLCAKFKATFVPIVKNDSRIYFIIEDPNYPNDYENCLLRLEYYWSGGLGAWAFAGSSCTCGKNWDMFCNINKG